MTKEKEFYEVIKVKVEELFKTKFDNIYLEITAEGNFNQKIKQKISRNREIIFSFLTKNYPDITGFVQRQYNADFIIIEIKKEIKLEDIYQVMRYRDLFDSRFTFLISIKSIPEEIKRLCNIAFILRCIDIYRFFVLTQFDEKNGQFIEWYPENPFEKDLYWR